MWNTCWPVVGPLAPWQFEQTSAAGAFTVSVAVRVTPPALAVRVAVVAVATEVVATVKVAVVAPARTVTDAGTVADALLEERVTARPPVGAAAERVTVPVEDDPPVTEAGLTETLESADVTAGAFTVSDAVRVTPPALAVRVTEVAA